MVSRKSQARQVTLRILCQVGILPSLWQLANPFKIYEYRAVLEGVLLTPSDSVLDLGCGGGLQTQLLARRGLTALGVDTSPTAIEQARKHLVNPRLRSRVSYVCADLLHAQLPQNSYEHIFSFCVLEHIPHYQETLAECNRILQPGGHLHISVDSLATISDEELRHKHQSDHHVHQYFSTSSLEQALLSAGFEVRAVFPIFKGPLAAREFSKRIWQRQYRKGPVRRYLLFRRLVQEDQQYQNATEGIMLVAHAAKREQG